MEMINPMPFVFALSIIGAIIHLAVTKWPKHLSEILKIFLLYQLVINVGIGGLLGFYSHAFMSDETARYIGWPTGNPFQLEVAYTNLTFGILGLLCIWLRGQFWLATILAVSIWLLADAYGHFRQMILYHNDAPGNAGIPFFADIILPIVLLSLLLAHHIVSTKAGHSFYDNRR